MVDPLIQIILESFFIMISVWLVQAISRVDCNGEKTSFVGINGNLNLVVYLFKKIPSLPTCATWVRAGDWQQSLPQPPRWDMDYFLSLFRLLSKIGSIKVRLPQRLEDGKFVTDRITDSIGVITTSCDRSLDWLRKEERGRGPDYVQYKSAWAATVGVVPTAWSLILTRLAYGGK